jgi:hypothetical protein
MTYIRTDAWTHGRMAHSLHIYIYMAGVRFDWLRHEMNERKGRQAGRLEE